MNAIHKGGLLLPEKNMVVLTGKKKKWQRKRYWPFVIFYETIRCLFLIKILPRKGQLKTLFPFLFLQKDEQIMGEKALINLNSLFF